MRASDVFQAGPGQEKGGGGVNSNQAIKMVGANPQNGRRQRDFYPTPPEVTQALIDFLDFSEKPRVWEPACGEGDMVDVFRKNGFGVTGTDLIGGVNFLDRKVEVVCDMIVTNPPFELAPLFIERCVELKKPFALLLKSQFWHAKCRLDLFKKYPPKWVLPLTWRPDFFFKDRANGEKGSPLMDVMWVVWDGTQNASITGYLPLEKPKGGDK